MQLATEVLSGSQSLRLDRRLVYEKELARSMGAFLDDGEIAGGAAIVVTVKPGVDPDESGKTMEAVLPTT